MKVINLNQTSMVSHVTKQVFQNRKIEAPLSMNLCQDTGKLLKLNLVKTGDYRQHHQIQAVNIAIFGTGNVGGTLIDQILESGKSIEECKHIRLNIFAVGNSQKLLLGKSGMNENWRAHLEEYGKHYDVWDIITYAQVHRLDNLIAVDNTASEEFIENYQALVKNGFDLVSSNKTGNAGSYEFYQSLRQILRKTGREYLYEANVGAGLPLIDTIRLLHISGDKIYRIQGVFSGSLSYIFNNFSSRDIPFHQVLSEAAAHGLTEPDPREDLSGKDVSRKLIILARELGICQEYESIENRNLIPEDLGKQNLDYFLNNLQNLDSHFEAIKQRVKPGHVLRHIGELSIHRKNSQVQLKAGLSEVPENSALGQLSGSDSLFEIYTEGYGTNPIIIRGAGAGATVTARGVFGDILRLADRVKKEKVM